MAYATRELLTTQTRSTYPRIAPGPDGVQVKTLAAVGAAPTYAAGTPLARSSATNKWVIWTNGGANDTGVIRGFLYPDATVIDAANDVHAQVMVKGAIHYEDIPIPAGEVIADLKAALRDGPRALNLDILGLDLVI